VKNWLRIFVLALLLVAAFSLAVKGESNHAMTQSRSDYPRSEGKIDNFSFGPQSIHAGT
jgi:hypothetical protein